jgi:transketolase
MPLNPLVKLLPNALDLKTLDQAPIRKGYGEGLVLAGDADPNVVALCADLTESTMTLGFAKKYPGRFVEMGVAEQNLAAVASGMAAMGKVPFISSYAMFSPGRNWEQIRTTICYNGQHVVVAGAHAGVSVGPDGATHQAIEDMAIMRVIANMTVLAPSDVYEARKATVAAAKHNGPVYIRFAREKTPIFSTLDTPFEIGKAQVYWQARGEPQAAIIACGPLVHNALLAAGQLEKEGIGIIVLNNPSIKPIDEEHVVGVANSAGAVVTVEEHQVIGGLGSAVAEVLAKHKPVPIEFVGVQNRFGESGEPNELIEKFGMGVGSIVEAVKKVISRK